jgi:amyloid beta precursor protein binding protein 1
VKALDMFVKCEGNGCLPLTGKVPDMKSDTDSFIKLQKMYLVLI